MKNWYTRFAVLGSISTLAALACPGAGAVAQATPPRALVHDPFDRSVVQELMREAAPPPAPPPAEPPPPSAPVVTAELRAVMVRGARSLVNLGGTILGIGESAGGLRLVEVRERSAVFATDGGRVEVPLGRRQGP